MIWYHKGGRIPSCTLTTEPERNAGAFLLKEENRCPGRH
nr:MAG TPA: hypothetical protein [Caudoviricetes sp.]